MREFMYYKEKYPQTQFEELRERAMMILTLRKLSVLTELRVIEGYIKFNMILRIE